MAFVESKEVIQTVIDIYSKFQEDLLSTVEEEKFLNNFLQNIPSTTQMIAIEDLSRMILKEDTIHSEKKDQLNNFIADVKNECMMDANYCTFMSLPECILKKNYSRKQFEIVTKLLTYVKNQYLQERNAREAEEAERLRKEAELNAKDKKNQ